MARPETIIQRLAVPEEAEGIDGAIRFMLMIYLMDWKAALEFGKPITTVAWKRGHSAVFSLDIVTAWTRLRSAKVHGGTLAVDANDKITPQEERVVFEIYERWRHSSIEDLFRICTSTFPVIATEHDATLNLPELARRYKREFAQQRALA